MGSPPLGIFQDLLALFSCLDNMGLATKTVFGVSDKARFKPVSSAT